MPLANLTAVANLALDHLGEPYLASYDADTGTTAEAVRLHLPQCVETVLEGHAWSFATRCSQLLPVPLVVTTATLTTGTAEDDNAILWTAAVPGPSGNDLSVAIAEPADVFSFAQTGSAVAITPGNVAVNSAELFQDSGSTLPFEPPALLYGGEYGERPFYTNLGESPGLASYASRIFLNYDPFDEYWRMSYIDDDLVAISQWRAKSDALTPDLIPAGAYHPDTNPEGWENDYHSGGTPVFTLGTLTAAQLLAWLAAQDPSPLSNLTAELPEGTTGAGELAESELAHLAGGSSENEVYAPAWGAAFSLPEDCLRLLKIDGVDLDAPQDRFEIEGRYLLLEDPEAEPVIHYISTAAPVTEWPTTFTDAVALLLASRLAPKLTQDHNLAAAFLARHETALGKARSKDARETRSKENHGPRQLAARSGLVQARLRGLRPTATTGEPAAPTSAPDLDTIFDSNL
jgi:hypothetical protein